MTARGLKAIVPQYKPTSSKEERTMEPMLMPAYDLYDSGEDVDQEELLVHEWRREQLHRLGLPGILAETFADLVDWHALARLVERVAR
jgi:hypothetical protein